MYHNDKKNLGITSKKELSSGVAENFILLQLVRPKPGKYLQFPIFSAFNYSISNIILPVIFPKVSYLFAEICDIKSASSSKIIPLDILVFGLRN